MVFEFLDPQYLKTKLDLIDISLSSLRDGLRGTDARTLTDLYNQLSSIYARLDVALSTRASESTLTGFSAKFPSAIALGDTLSNPTTTIIGGALLGFDGTYWRRVRTDGEGRLKAQLDTIPNPSNLDITLSSLRDALRGADNRTLTDIYNQVGNVVSRLPTSLTTAGNFKIALLEDNVGILKDNKIPNPLGILTNLDVIGTTTNPLATVNLLTPSRQPYLLENINVTTTEGSSSISAPGARIVKIKNKGDVDALIGINGAVPTTNPLKVRPRSIIIFPHKGVTQINYKTATGTTTIDIEYYN